nr:DUF6449 domain-containing protein [uncultured Lachnoanaerobaculum sp.]
MTSKSLFFKLLKEDFKVRIWTLAVSILIFFFSHIVGTAMMLSMYKYNSAFSEPTDLLSYKVEFVQTFYSYIGIKNPLFAFVFVVLAVVVAMSGFSYLYSKKKVDMYHSLPVRREVLFFVKTLNGILIVILPYIVCSFIASLLVLVNMGDAGIIVKTFFSVAEWILLFIFNYTIVIFAIMLTGNMLVGILACGFLNFYAPAFSKLISGYEITFFDTYYKVGFIAEKVLLKLSGIMVIFGVFDGRLREKMIIAVAGSIILLIINLLLYKKRASESAGKSISFNIIKLPIKFMIVIFMSMLMYLFGYVMMNNSIAWGVFGAVSAGIITHCIMEIIYNQDFKKIFAKKLQMLICIVISLFVAAIFQFDIFGYDRYIPKVSDISSAAVVSDFLESNTSQYFNKMGFHNETRYDSITNIDYASDRDIESMIMREMNIKDKEAVVALAKLGVANLSSEWRADSISERVLISYKLKSGKKVQRVYNIDFDAAIKELSSIYDDEGYKTGMYPILSEDSKNIVSVDFNGIRDNDKQLTSENGDLAKLAEVYKKELMSLKYDTKVKSYPFASIRFNDADEQKILDAVYKDRGNYSDYSSDNKYADLMDYVGYYPVYPEFKETVDMLKEMGVDVKEKMSVEDIDRIEVSEFKPEQIETYYDSYNETGTKVFTDAKDIEEILDKVVVCDSPYKEDLNEDVNFNVLIYLKSDVSDAYGGGLQYHFKRGDIPEIVK